MAGDNKDDELLAINDVFDKFTALDPQNAQLIKLCYFADLTSAQKILCAA